MVPSEEIVYTQNDLDNPMSYRIPSDSQVSNAILAVVERYPHISTQRELEVLVRAELMKRDGKFRVKGTRIRRIGLERDILGLRIEYRESSSKVLPRLCPVCGYSLESVRNMTLDGNIVEMRRRCMICPYEIGQKMMVPGKYEFIRSKGDGMPDGLKAIKKLEMARSKLMEASDLIHSALQSTMLVHRIKDFDGDLDALSASKERPHSISNMIADLASKEEDVWTRPLSSVKNAHRKDI